jgi:hypothetical protein
MGEDFDGAVRSLDAMQAGQGESMTCKPYCTVIAELIEHKALTQAIDVLEKAGKRFPEKQAIFREQARKIQIQGLTDEALERLQPISYL